MIFSVTGLGWAGADGMGRARLSASPRWRPGAPDALDLQQLFERPEGRSGRLDAFSRLGLAALAQALVDAGRLPGAGERRPTALIAHSVRGCLPTDADYHRTVLPQAGKLASPQLFAYTLPTCFLGEAAIRFRLTGATFVVSGPDSLAALTAGLDLVASGDADAVACGFVDLPPPPELGLPDTLPVGSVFLVAEQGNLPGSLARLERDAAGVRPAGAAAPAALLDLFHSLLASLENHQ